MNVADHQLDRRRGAGSSDPLGWTLAMRLCNALIAVILLAFLVFVALEVRAPELF
jgi:hypothetical protein